MMSFAGIQTKTYTYKVVGKLSLTVDVSTRDTFSGEAEIALLHFHGGFLTLGDKNSHAPNWLINAAHRRRWAYVTASYRLLPEADGLDIVEDAIDAAVWVSKNVAPRILLAGSSAGGYLALAIAANRRAPPLLATLFIYGMLNLTASRYVRAGTNLGGAPPVETQELLEQVTVAMQSGDVIDGYEFPAQPPTDRRFRWVAALHQDAVIPDVLTRMPGLSQNIRELGTQVIPEQLRDLFPATFRLTKAFPPTALLHGDADILVDYRQSSGLAERLGTLGINVLLEKAVGQGHGFDVKSIPSSIDVHLQRADDPEFYQSLRRVLMFLDSIIAKANTSSTWIQE